MTESEYKIRLDNLEQEFEKQKINLAKVYAHSHRLFQEGDTISDTVGSIIIDAVKFTRGSFNSLPECVYYGLELKKDGKLRKDGGRRSIYQSHIKPNH